MNAKVEGYEVDAYFPRAKVVVELDGYEYHRTAAESDRDSRRDAALKLKGYEVLRVSDRWLAADPAGVARAANHLIRRQNRA
jgi:very-short-patch-repair endonuclease